MTDPRRKLILDPRIFEQYEARDPDAITLIFSLFRSNDSLKAPVLMFDDQQYIAKSYWSYLEKVVQGSRYDDYLANALVAAMRSSEHVQLETLPPELLKLCQSYALSSDRDIEPVLISLMTSDDEVIVIFAENHQSTNLFNIDGVREKICRELGRSALYAMAEYNRRPEILTEGKTDWKYLKAALRDFNSRGQFIGLLLDFHGEKIEDDVGSPRLLQMLERIADGPDISRTAIFIFDRDIGDADRRKVSDSANSPGQHYRWKSYLYSFLLPVPSHRQNIPNDISIEFFFNDTDLFLEDSNGRRLYVGTEFRREIPCQHIENQRIFLYDRNHAGKHRIVDSTVYLNDATVGQVSIALSKDAFATSILDKEYPFHCMDFSEFYSIFEIIQAIRDCEFSSWY